MLLVALGVVVTFSGTAPAGLDMFSVNLWATGKAWGGGAWEDPATHDLLRLGPDQAAGVGAWNTTGWENVGWGASPFSTSLAPTTITSSGGSTATLEIIQQRNASPWNWNSLRDDSDAVDVGNATLLDGHSNGTNVPADGGSRIFGMTVSDIPFGAYDVIVYLGANSGQVGDGTGKVVLNGIEKLFKLPGTEPDGTLIEALDGENAGNYVVFEGVSGSSFSLQAMGVGADGYNHVGPAGIQIAVPEPATIGLLAFGGLGLVRRRRNG